MFVVVLFCIIWGYMGLHGITWDSIYLQTNVRIHESSDCRSDDFRYWFVAVG